MFPAFTRILLMMSWRYREDRATQAAARLLHLRGGTMSYMKLIKLLYIADRRALARFGRPITFDSLASMDLGPVLSNTLNLVKEEPDPFVFSYWAEHISAPSNYEVSLIGENVPNDQLSPAEEALLDEVFEEFKHFTRWELSKLTHEFAEYQYPNGSALPISVRKVLLAQGVSEEDANAIVQDLSAAAYLEQMAG
ncbi:MAG: Panacea domain-containing protein [Gemmatimonadaceae bacterium]